MGPSGVKAIKERLPKIINDKKVDFVVVNGENAADDGVGISKKNSDDIFFQTAQRTYFSNLSMDCLICS